MTPAPLAHTGIEWAYARVSSRSQDLKRQLHAITEAGIPDRHTYVDKKTGKNLDREGWNALRPRMREGDLLTVETIDRIGRNQTEMILLFNELRAEGIHVRCLGGPIPLDTRVPGPGTDMALALLNFLGTVELIYKRERVASARRAGKNVHRPRKLTPEMERQLAEDYADNSKTVEALAEEYGVSRATAYRIVNERKAQGRPRAVPQGRGRSLTDAQIAMARRLRQDDGMSIRKIAAAIGSSAATVQRALAAT